MRLLKALLAIILCPGIAHARLGETLIQFVDRYGPPQKKPISTGLFPPLLREAEIRYYEKAGWKITAAFIDITSPSICVEFRKANAAALTDEEITTILTANSGGMKWRQVIYHSASSPDEPSQRAGEAILAPALGMMMWQRTDGATASLQVLKTALRLESPEAKKHEENIKQREIKRAQTNRPKF